MDGSPSDDRLRNEGTRLYGHQRSMSGQSVSTIIGEPLQQEAGGYDGYGPYATRQPANAYTQDPGPTPRVGDSYYYGGGGAAVVNRPLPSQAHPGEY